MHSNLNPQTIQKKIKELEKHYPIIQSAVSKIASHGGKAFLVGGAVRDLLLDLTVHDLDIEVHNVSLEQLSELLSEFGHVDYVGKSFGVLKMFNYPIDWSLPRTDSPGRKPNVSIDPHLSIVEALRRRDLTMNAMAIDLSTYEFIDPFLGYQAIQAKILRAPDKQFFSEDPLRFYRVMQFISRFEMYPDEELTEMCKTMDIRQVSRERIEAEFQKMILKSVQPSLGIRWLESIGRIKEILPELYATITTPQDPVWHPEGNVFEHLMESVDAAAVLSYESEEQKIKMVYAALCHDLGKATMTIWKDERWRSPGHAQAGAPLAKKMLKRITHNDMLIKAVEKLTYHHMDPLGFIKSNASPAAYKRLALKLEGYATLNEVAQLMLADNLGRNPQKYKPLTGSVKLVDEFRKKALEAGVFYTVEKPLLHGRDIAQLVNPGPRMGKALKFAYEYQIKHDIKDKDILLREVKNWLKGK